MFTAIAMTQAALAMIVFAAAPRYARAWRGTGNTFGLVAAGLCLVLGAWLLFAAYWLSTKP